MWPPIHILSRVYASIRVFFRGPAMFPAVHEFTLVLVSTDPRELALAMLLPLSPFSGKRTSVNVVLPSLAMRLAILEFPTVDALVILDIDDPVHCTEETLSDGVVVSEGRCCYEVAKESIRRAFLEGRCVMENDKRLNMTENN